MQRILSLAILLVSVFSQVVIAQTVVSRDDVSKALASCKARMDYLEANAKEKPSVVYSTKFTFALLASAELAVTGWSVYQFPGIIPGSPRYLGASDLISEQTSVGVFGLQGSVFLVYNAVAGATYAYKVNPETFSSLLLGLSGPETIPAAEMKRSCFESFDEKVCDSFIEAIQHSIVTGQICSDMK